MRAIRTVDPQSGITTVREITLISTAGVTFNEYEELPEANHDVSNMGNQLTEAIYDTRKVLSEGNALNYQLMLNLAKEISSFSDAQALSREKASALSAEVALGGINAQLKADEDRGTLQTTAIDNLTNEIRRLGEKSESNANLVSTAIDNAAIVDNDSAENIANKVNDFAVQNHTDVDNLRETVRGVMDSRAIDSMTVTLDGETMTVNQAFTEIFSLLNEIKSKLDTTDDGESVDTEPSNV
jgi:type IV secretory pathway VirJ component